MVLTILFYFSLPFARPKEFLQKGEGFYLTNEHSTTIHDEFMPIWVKVKPIERPKEKIEVIEGQAQIENFRDMGRKIEFKTNSVVPAIVRVNTLYYPGWRVLVDEKIAPFSFENERGVIEIPVEKGEHQILIEFKETPFRMFANIISLVSFILIGGFLIKRRKFK